MLISVTLPVSAGYYRVVNTSGVWRKEAELGIHVVGHTEMTLSRFHFISYPRVEMTSKNTYPLAQYIQLQNTKAQAEDYTMI